MFNDHAQIRLGVNPIDFSIKEKEIQVENRCQCKVEMSPNCQSRDVPFGKG